LIGWLSHLGGEEEGRPLENDGENNPQHLEAKNGEEKKPSGRDRRGSI